MWIIFSSLFSIEVSPPIKISPDSVSGIGAFDGSMCVDSTGRIYVFWRQPEGIFFRYFENEVWSFPQQFLDVELDARRDGPVVDKYNRVWYFVGDVINIWGRYVSQDQLGPIIYVPVLPACNFWFKIAPDISGNLWIAWTTDLWSHQPIFTRYYNDSGWSDTFTVCYLDSLKEVGSGTSCLFGDKKGNMWIVYETILYENGYEIEGGIDATLMRKFENGKWGKYYIVDKGESATNFPDIIETQSEYIIVFPRSIRIEGFPWRLELYALHFLDFSHMCLIKIWSQDSVAHCGMYPFLFGDDKNRAWLLSNIKKKNQPLKPFKVYLQLFDGRWLEPIVAELNDSFQVKYIGDASYDPFRKRIWFTYDVRDTINKKLEVYIRYIDLKNVSTNYDFGFLIFPTIIRNNNMNMISLMGVKESDIIDMYIYDLSGRRLKEIVKSLSNVPDFYRFYWTPREFSSGTYFICLKTKTKKKFLKFILLK